MKVLILWADPHSPNLGVRALAAGAAAIANESLGDVEIAYQSFEPGPLGMQFSGQTLIQGFKNRHKQLTAALQEYDLVLDTGAGDSFTDIYGYKRLIIMSYARMIAAKSGTPLVLAPQTIGPFRRGFGKFLARRTLRVAAATMARDRISAIKALELYDSNYVRASDLVFALSQPEARSEPRDVILNISGLLWNENVHVDYLKYREHMLHATRALLDQGRQVSLLAHVVDNPSKDNDVFAIAELRELLEADLELITPSTLEEARSVFRSANLVIGARMHACLNSLSVGTVAVPLAYSRKFAPLLEDIGWPFTIDLRRDDDVVPGILDLARDSGLQSKVQNLLEVTRQQMHVVGDTLRDVVITSRNGADVNE